MAKLKIKSVRNGVMLVELPSGEHRMLSNRIDLLINTEGSEEAQRSELFINRAITLDVPAAIGDKSCFDRSAKIPYIYDSGITHQTLVLPTSCLIDLKTEVITRQTSRFRENRIMVITYKGYDESGAEIYIQNNVGLENEAHTDTEDGRLAKQIDEVFENCPNDGAEMLTDEQIGVLIDNFYIAPKV